MTPNALAVWLARLETRHPNSIELGLDRVAQVRDRMGIDLRCPVITVGGTNGKGSICAYLGAILQMAGFRVGIYTSPHLVLFNERIVIDSRQVDDASLVEALEVVESARAGVLLTYFEHTTLAALWLFQKAGLDAAVLEVGLGGRLDAVNCIDPDCAIVASVDLDHQDYLGSTREAIGFEKAGIFRAGQPAICADTNPPESLLQQADNIGAKLIRLGSDIQYRVGDGNWECRVLGEVFPALPFPALRGPHQLANAAAALAAIRIMHARLPVPLSAMRAGLAKVELPGRFQVVGYTPLRVLDVAHNPHAARALARLLADMPPSGRTLAVFAMLADKDIAGVIEALKPHINFWHVAALPGPRGASAAMLAEHLTHVGCPYRCHDNVGSAWQVVCQESEPADTIVAFGSFLTIAEIMASMH